VTAPKRGTGDPGRSSAPAESSSLRAAIRTVERASRKLGDVLSDTRRLADSLAPPPKLASGVRRRLRCAIVVAADGHLRHLLVEQLIAEGFVVEWVTCAEEARFRAARCDPDLVVVEHSPGDGLEGELVRVTAVDPIRRPRIVVTLHCSVRWLSRDRSVSIIQWRDTGADFYDIIRAIASGAGASA
jgi:hypothetical protein